MKSTSSSDPCHPYKARGDKRKEYQMSISTLNQLVIFENMLKGTIILKGKSNPQLYRLVFPIMRIRNITHVIQTNNIPRTQIDRDNR